VVSPNHICGDNPPLITFAAIIRRWCGGRLDDGAPEEVGIDAVELHLVGEDEVAELLLVEEAVFDEFPRFFERFAEIGYVPNARCRSP
jgi:hypothetical protein